MRTCIGCSKKHFKKTFKAKCGYCGNYGYNAVDYYERKTNQEKKNIGDVFQPSELVENNNYQQRKSMCALSDHRRRGKFNKSD